MRFGNSENDQNTGLFYSRCRSKRACFVSKNDSEKVLQFIQDELVGYCQNGQYICDEIGMEVN
jgi:hypothetical protein